MVADPLKINSSAPCQLHPEFFSIRNTDSGKIKLNEGVTENFLVMMLISKYFSKVLLCFFGRLLRGVTKDYSHNNIK